MKSIDERAEEWDANWRAGRIELQALSIHHYIHSALTELAADLQAEKEKELAELRKALEEKDAMSATIAQQDALLDEAKRVLAIAQPDVCYMCCPAKPTDGRDWVHEEECESVRQLLTRLGGSHE